MGKKDKNRVTRHIEKVFSTRKTISEAVVDSASVSEKHDKVSEEGEEYIRKDLKDKDHLNSSSGLDDDDEYAMEEEEEEQDYYSDIDESNNDDEADEEAEDEDGSQSDSSDYKNLKRRKKETTAAKDGGGGKRSMGDLLGQILGTNTNSVAEESSVESGGHAPILAKRKAIERKLAEAKLDARARAALRRERLASRDAPRCRTVDPAGLNKERAMRRAATKGVVQLFNAIHQVQTAKEKKQKDALDDGKRSLDNTGKDKKAPSTTTTTELTKANFLDLLKAGGVKKKI